jgi:hypothetical protein
MLGAMELFLALGEVDPPQQIKACAWAFKLRQSRAIVCF